MWHSYSEPWIAEWGPSPQTPWQVLFSPQHPGGHHVPCGSLTIAPQLHKQLADKVLWQREICELFWLHRGITSCMPGSGSSILFGKHKWQSEVLALNFPQLFSFTLDQTSLSPVFCRKIWRQHHLPCPYQNKLWVNYSKSLRSEITCLWTKKEDRVWTAESMAAFFSASRTGFS